MNYLFAAILVYLASYAFHPNAEWEFLLGCSQLVVVLLSIEFLRVSHSLSVMHRSVAALFAIACALDFAHYVVWVMYDVNISGALAVGFFTWLGFLILRPYNIEGEELEYGKVFILVKKPSNWVDHIRALIGVPAASICIRINDTAWSYRHRTGIFEKFDADTLGGHVLINTGVPASRRITSALNALVGSKRGIGIKCIWGIRGVLELLGERFKVRTLFDCIPGLYLRKIVRQKGAKWTCNSHSI